MQTKTPMVSAPTGTRIRAYLLDELIADSRDVLLVRESPVKIHYAFPEKDVAMRYLTKREKEPESPSKGRIRFYHLKVGEETREKSAFAYPDQKEGRPDLRGYILFNWNVMDHWYEEEEELFGHPRDPYTRIDVRASSRHVVVEAGGTVIADTKQPRLLMETGLPVRYYIPNEDINWDYLVPSEKTTVCPYKGRSTYWSIQVNGNAYRDTAWAYPEPLQDAERVRDTVCFQQENLTVYVDGEVEQTPSVYFLK